MIGTPMTQGSTTHNTASEACESPLGRLQILFCGHIIEIRAFPSGSDSKEPTYSVGDLGSIPGLGRSSGEGKDNPLQCSCLENPHGQRILVDYSPRGCKESDMTEQLSTAHTG